MTFGVKLKLQAFLLKLSMLATHVFLSYDIHQDKQVITTNDHYKILKRGSIYIFDTLIDEILLSPYKIMKVFISETI